MNLNTEQIDPDLEMDVNDIDPGLEKIIFIYGSGSAASFATLKTLLKNKNFRILYFYTDSEKEFILKFAKSSPRLIIKPFDKFMKVLDYSLAHTETKHVDYIVNFFGLEEDEVVDENDLKTQMLVSFANYDLPRIIAGKIIESKKNVKLINFTDLSVFYKNNQYNIYYETSEQSPSSFFGKTKSIGELNIRNVLNLRADVIGENIKNKIGLLEDFLQKKEGSVIEASKNKFWNGITALKLAEIINNIIKNDLEFSYLQHVFSEEISEYDFYQILSKVFNKKIKILEVNTDKSGRILKTINYDFYLKLFDNKIDSIEKMLIEAKDILINE